jgi:hypothetical protein
MEAVAVAVDRIPDKDGYVEPTMAELLDVVRAGFMDGTVHPDDLADTVGNGSFTICSDQSMMDAQWERLVREAGERSARRKARWLAARKAGA